MVLLLARLPLWIYAFPERLLTDFAAKHYNHYEAEHPACTFFNFFSVSKLYANFNCTVLPGTAKPSCSLILEQVFGGEFLSLGSTHFASACVLSVL